MNSITRREFISSVVIGTLLSIPVIRILKNIFKRRPIVPVRALFWKRL
ncbi:MAG: hypothetical protein ACUVWP_08250 [bacterium]